MEKTTDNQTTNNTGAWFDKNDPLNFRLIFDPNEEPPEGFVRAQPLPGVVFQKYDEATEQWLPDKDAEKRANAKTEYQKILEEIAETDYKAIKAVRLKMSEIVEEFYPGLTNWYKERAARINELRAIIGNE